MDVVEHCRRRLSRAPQVVSQWGTRVDTAVVVPLWRDAAGVWHVLFERRARTLRRQPGEISFPGGHVEPTDASPRAAAWRETCEELGVRPEQLEYIGALDILATWGGMFVHPFAARVADDAVLHVNPAEVDELIRISLDQLLTHTPRTAEMVFTPKFPADFPFELVPGGRSYRWRRPTVTQWFYELAGVVIWGLTGRILHDFLERIR